MSNLTAKMNQTSIKINGKLHIYHPHQNDGEGTVVTGVYLSTGGWYPSSRFFPRSLVPGPFPRGYPSPGWGYPGPSSRTGVPPSEDNTGVPICQDWGIPSLGSGVSPPPRQNIRVNTCYVVGVMPFCSHAGGLSCFKFGMMKVFEILQSVNVKMNIFEIKM